MPRSVLQPLLVVTIYKYRREKSTPRKPRSTMSYWVFSFIYLTSPTAPSKCLTYRLQFKNQSSSVASATMRGLCAIRTMSYHVQGPYTKLDYRIICSTCGGKWTGTPQNRTCHKIYRARACMRNTLTTYLQSR